MPAKILSPIQAILMPRVDDGRNTLAASVVNCTIGKTNNVKVLIRRPASQRFYFMSQYNGERELTANKTDDGYIVTIPGIDPWSVGTVFCE